jgi:oxygen-independent coproporphyrinogen-3 oxidase
LADGLTRSAGVAALPLGPYCTAICHYCGCHTKATQREAPVRIYAVTPMADLRLTLDALGQRRAVTHSLGRWHAELAAAEIF